MHGSINHFYRCCMCMLVLLHLLPVCVSCMQTTAGKTKALNSEIEDGKNHEPNPSVLKIVSTGTMLNELKNPRIYFRYIQYSVDGMFLEAHKVKDHYERSIPLSAGKHKLHVERAFRGVLSARAYIVDDGDCYMFTLSEGQIGIFEGKATPDEEWETIGFSNVESWEKVDSIENCHE